MIVKIPPFSLIILTISLAYSTTILGVELSVSKSSDSMYTISGSNFGVAQEAIIHDDFDEGVSGQELKNFSVSSNSLSQNPIYNDLTAVTGKNSGNSRFLGSNFNSTAEHKGLGGLDHVYLSYYVKVDHLRGDLSRNIKLVRLSSGYKSKYIQMTGITLFHNNGSGIFYNYTGGTGDSNKNQKWISASSLIDGKWHRVEYHLILSSPAGNANGSATLKIDNKIVSNFENVVTEYTGNRVEWITLPYYVAHDAGGDYNIYYDNVVVSKNPARVEVCSSADYSSCQKPVLAKVTNWSNNEIRLKYPSGTNKYFYTFNGENNLLNDKGALMCSTCSTPPSTSPPLPPGDFK